MIIVDLVVWAAIAATALGITAVAWFLLAYWWPEDEPWYLIALEKLLAIFLFVCLIGLINWSLFQPHFFNGLME